MSRDKKLTLRRIKASQGQGDYEDLRKRVKNGSDFCKDLAAVLQERSDLESHYAKSLQKLSTKLLKASKSSSGSVAHAWQAVAVQLGVEGEAHSLLSSSISQELAKPLLSSTASHCKIRKSVETLVDKTARNLAEWRSLELKAKKCCWSGGREYDKMVREDLSPTTGTGGGAVSSVGSGAPSAEIGGRNPQATTKLRKLSQQLTHSNLDYYNTSIKAERARLEYEGALRNGSVCLGTLQEEKLGLLKELATKYLQQLTQHIPQLARSVDCLKEPISRQDVTRDMSRLNSCKRDGYTEQLLPDFYAEDMTNSMDSDRRREFLLKYSHLVRGDLERERRLDLEEGLAGCHGNSNHGVYDKLYYTKSMLIYLEGARYKLENVLADLEGRGRETNSISRYISQQRDKSGIPVSFLRVQEGEMRVGSGGGQLLEVGGGDCWGEGHDGVAKMEDDDFEDEFSSDGGGGSTASSHNNNNNNNNIEESTPSNMNNPPPINVNTPSVGSCHALYDYEASMYDELTIKAGDLISIHDKNEDGWWLGELNGVVGIFPATYVEEVDNLHVSMEEPPSSSHTTTATTTATNE